MNQSFVRIVSFNTSEELLPILGYEIIILPVARNVDNFILKSPNKIIKKVILDKCIKQAAQFVNPSLAHYDHEIEGSSQYISSLQANAELESCYFIPLKKLANTPT